MATRSYDLAVTPSAGVATRTVLIFFIPGNPGLIEYYQPFLTSLRQLLESSPASKSTHFHIHGQDLAGFNDKDHEPFGDKHPPRDVEYQVNHLFDRLSNLRVKDGPGVVRLTGKSYDDVILMGHSVGTYIALQLFQKLLKNPELAPRLHLKTGILLFPTIENIAQSPAGKRLDLLRRTPVLGPNAHSIAKCFLWLCPRGILSLVIHRILGFPTWAATVTLNFLKSRDGVWQALHMGMNEMEVIREDSWDDELWGIADKAKSNELPVPKFFFFFGKKDHWVANHLRDTFIERRSKQVEQTKLMVDDGDLPHAFCIGHSEIVAERVNDWINEIYVQDGIPRKTST